MLIAHIYNFSNINYYLKFCRGYLESFSTVLKSSKTYSNIISKTDNIKEKSESNDYKLNCSNDKNENNDHIKVSHAEIIHQV